MLFIIIGIIISIIATYFCYSYYKKLSTLTQEDIKTKEKNKIIEQENITLSNINKELKDFREQNKIKIKEQQEIIINANQISQKAYEQYCETLDMSYNAKEKEYEDIINELKEKYQEETKLIAAEVDKVKADLNKISQTRAAAIQAQLKENEIKNKRTFYCPQIPNNELKDVKILKEIEYKLNNPRILRMLIWSTFYQKPMNQVCANVLGGATAVKCGIYKITNQKNDICYIGQSKNIAARWKNHAKAGLGIDTPAGNKLYKAMEEDGLENFSFEIVEECNENELNEKEKFYIELYQSNDYGYNSTIGNDK